MERKILQKIRDVVGKEGLLITPEERACYSYDATGQSYMPDAVALPKTPSQVAIILKLANHTQTHPHK
ncbi:MAG: FAD-binding oxidoreductase, partial [Candidatus Electrothrix sp. AR3]|nr:FAD-binding oxidoreductase [Candidatus Electrothrix sp. AR3]